MGGFLFFVAFVLGVAWALAWIVRSIHEHQRTMQVLKLQAELHNRLFERYGTDPALLDFLKSSEQRQIFAAQVPDPSMSRIPAPYGRVLTMVQAACLLLAAGVAFLVIRGRVTGRDETEMALFFGTFFVALGVGALASAGAVVVISKLWPRPDSAGGGRL